MTLGLPILLMIISHPVNAVHGSIGRVWLNSRLKYRPACVFLHYVFIARASIPVRLPSSPKDLGFTSTILKACRPVIVRDHGCMDQLTCLTCQPRADHDALVVVYVFVRILSLMFGSDLRCFNARREPSLFH